MKNKFNKMLSLFLTIALTIYSLFIPLLQVKANGNYMAKITGNQVAFRSEANTNKKSNVYEYLYSGDKITVTNDQTNEYTDCSAGWYAISYNGNNGYVCSKYISTDLSDFYGRPWTTPKKSIMGGAKFISNSYVNNGQYTAYLEHFNVNPASTSETFNHAYQTDIEAAASFAVNEQRALWKNENTKNLPLTFTIPIFNNMADNYLCADCSKHPKITPEDKLTAAEYVAKTNDTEYEKYLDSQKFPESYKVYLRQLHIEHSNWIFKSLDTTYDFDKAATIFANGTWNAINSSWATDAICYNNKCADYPIENGWGYAASKDAIAYYLDPRNFLTETYVFEFMNLNNDESYSESTINSVLANSFMADMDIIDNQTYASIFLEAGKTYGVNPLYLAAHTLIEIGSKGTQSAATGSQFTYNGVTYSGLFNFLSVGASSGSYSGLVYASGGYCTICANYVIPTNNSNTNNDNSSNTNTTTNTNTTLPVNVVNYVTSLNNIGASLNGSYVKGFGIGTAISTLKNKDSNVNYSTNDIIATGTLLSFADGSSYTAVIYGDLTGDGKINSADLLKMRQYLLGATTLSGAYNEAANIVGSGNINSANLLKLRQYLLGNSDISQN
jgi:beta-N-acetylglucosaminidase